MIQALHVHGVSGFAKHFEIKFDFEFVQIYINWSVIMIFHFRISALPKIVILKLCVCSRTAFARKTAKGHHQKDFERQLLFHYENWCIKPIKRNRIENIQTQTVPICRL